MAGTEQGTQETVLAAVGIDAEVIDLSQLAAAAQGMRSLMNAMPPIPAHIMEKAAEMGLAEDLVDNVKKRVLAGVMDKLAKMLTETSKAIKQQMSAQFLGSLVLLGEGEIEIPGWCTLAKKGHVSTSVDKTAIAAQLLANGVSPDVIELAMDMGTKQTKQDIVDLRWDSGKPKKPKKKKKGEEQ